MRIYLIISFLFLALNLQAFTLSNDSVFSSFRKGTQLEMNGLLISGIYSEINTMRGLQIGGFNNNHQTFGLQIGLFNRSNKLKGLQLGLWNKNGKLGLPFLNIGW